MPEERTVIKIPHGNIDQLTIEQCRESVKDFIADSYRTKKHQKFKEHNLALKALYIRERSLAYPLTPRKPKKKKKK